MEWIQTRNRVKKPKKEKESQCCITYCENKKDLITICENNHKCCLKCFKKLDQPGDCSCQNFESPTCPSWRGKLTLRTAAAFDVEQEIVLKFLERCKAQQKIIITMAQRVPYMFASLIVEKQLELLTDE